MQLTGRVLSRIYLLGEKSRVAEGNKLPRGVGGGGGPGSPSREFLVWCILRHNFEKCYSVCNDLVSGLFFQYSYLYTIVITMFFGRKLGIFGGKLLPLKYPR